MRARTLLMALAVVICGCSDDEPDPNQAVEEPVLDVGPAAGASTCMLVAEELPAEVEELPIIGCDVPHTHEIYATIEYDDKDVYPGVEELGAFAGVECLTAFEEFVGISNFDSSLSYTWLVPSLTGWNDSDDRDVLCVLADRDGAELTGSMRGTDV